jgi:hypothetical protein
MPANRESWRHVYRKEDSKLLNGRLVEQLIGSRCTGTFAIAGGGECRFVRLVNISRNHSGNGHLAASAWETLERLVG